MKTQSRFSSGALWVSIISLCILLLAQVGLGDAIPLGVDVFAVGVIGILSFLGIVTNPKDGKWYWSRNTPWSERLRDRNMWVGLIALFTALVFQILEWCGVTKLPFDLNACLMTFLAIMQSVGVINGQPAPVGETAAVAEEVQV